MSGNKRQNIPHFFYGVCTLRWIKRFVHPLEASELGETCIKRFVHNSRLDRVAVGVSIFRCYIIASNQILMLLFPGILQRLNNKYSTSEMEKKLLERRDVMTVFRLFAIMDRDKGETGRNLAINNGKSEATKDECDGAEPSVACHFPGILDACKKRTQKGNSWYEDEEYKIHQLANDGWSPPNGANEMSPGPGFRNEGGGNGHK
mmetsp:Transcript_2224/g.4876  ORF Transcript_2224/g.4876 Transcript_2224/m.4876 type:complete len:204 (-) Transcript_2224:681-1292(-)